jgi:uroporphyrin-III C-methyltransferase
MSGPGEDPRGGAPGTVSLVGAGPGDPDLLTLRALQRLQQADVVLHDALFGDELLRLAGPRARLVPVGKRGGGDSTSQQWIHAMLVHEARQGRRVVRLKGGDPFVFGRGGEEALHLLAHGIPFEVVPGVSSAIAAPAAIGIPVTHRGVSKSFTVVTASSADDEQALASTWRHLLGAGGTLVFLMGLQRLDAIARALLEAGAPPTLDAAVISQAWQPQQRHVVDQLDRIAEAAALARLEAPATLVVGPVVAIGARMQQPPATTSRLEEPCLTSLAV